MKKLLKNISIIQIILFVILFFTMYIPVVRIKGGNTNDTFNSFLCIFGINADKEKSFSKWYSFSFLCLLPYLLLLASVAINIFFDNRKALWAHIVKVVIFFTSAIMLCFFQKLMVPGGISKEVVLNRTTNLYGNYIQMGIVIVMLILSVIEILIDFNVINTNERITEE